MRFFALLSAFVALFGSLATAAQAAPAKGHAPAAKVSATAHLAPRKVMAKPVVAVATTEMRRGRVSIASGPLAGAVVQLPNTDLRAVTNADGEFALAVPTNSGPLQATVTYAGFADEEALLLPGKRLYTVTMTTAQPIAVDRQHRLKVYEHTAMKEVNRSLRQVRKS